MPSEVRPLRELCSLIADCPHSTPVWTDSGHIVIRNQNIKNGRLDLSAPSFTDAEHFAHRTRRARPTAGDIIFTREAPMGEVCMVPKGLECCVGQRQVLLRPNPVVVDGAYLLYALQSPQVQHEIGWSEGTGSTVSNVRIPILESLRIPTPSIAEQREVAGVLGALDDKIALLRETNATLEAIAQALFKSWFVDFDPMRAKAEGCDPEGVPPEVADLFPSEFEDSELGEIPKGWRSGTLADIAQLNPESWTANKHPSTVSYIDLANTKDNFIADVTDYAFYEAPSRARRVLRDGDTIVGTVRPGNRSFAYIHEPPSNLTASTGFAVLRPAGAHLAGFLYLAVTQDSSIEHLAHVADGAAYPAVRPEVVAGIQCTIPNEEVMRAFQSVAAPMLGSIAENHRKAGTLAELRDTLLPRLMSGKLRIPEIQEAIEETAP